MVFLKELYKKAKNRGCVLSFDMLRQSSAQVLKINQVSSAELLLLLLISALMLSSCGGSTTSTQSSQGKLILDQNHGDGGNAWGKENCDSCHAIKAIHESATSNIRELTRKKGYDSCVACHGSNGTQAVRQCLTCHNDQDLPKSPLTDGGKVHHFKEEITAKLNDKECLTCHEASNMNGIFSLNTDLTHFKNKAGVKSDYQSEAEFCQSCHNRAHQQTDFPIIGEAYDDPLIAIEDDYQFFDYHGYRDGSDQGTYNGLREGYRYPQVVNCTDCHAMHGTHNKQLIIDSSQKGVKSLQDSFRNKPYAVDTDGANGTVAGDYAQLCVLCHKMEVINDSGAINAGNGLSGVHEVDSDCRDCHTHGEATQIGL